LISLTRRLSSSSEASNRHADPYRSSRLVSSSYSGPLSLHQMSSTQTQSIIPYLKTCLLPSSSIFSSSTHPPTTSSGGAPSLSRIVYHAFILDSDKISTLRSSAEPLSRLLHTLSLLRPGVYTVLVRRATKLRTMRLLWTSPFCPYHRHFMLPFDADDC
jgi:hypothetical protein